MNSRRHAHVVNENDIEWARPETHKMFGAARKRLGGEVGAEKIGCTLFEVEPGKRAFPMHAHSMNEEAVYVLAGTGTLRIGTGDAEQQVPIRAGDFMAFPASLRLAHQIVNTSEEILRYLCISTQSLPEVLVYPDSKKVGLMVQAEAGLPDWPELRGRSFKLLRDEDSLGYYDGE